MSAHPHILEKSPSHPFAPDRLAHAPLLPIALAITIGILLDRYSDIPFGLSFFTSIACLIAWTITQRTPQRGLAALYLWSMFACLGAAYHHHERRHFAPNDIGELVDTQSRWVRIRGTLADEPLRFHQPATNVLIAFQWPDSTVFTLDATQIQIDADWMNVSGRVRVRIQGKIAELHAGDEIETSGQLSGISPPSNPGSFDQRERLLDQRIRSELRVKDGESSLVRLQLGWTHSLNGWIGIIRGWGQRVLSESLPPERSGLAIALLLGEGSPLTRDDWSKYQRTGVIHVLAISGQHLVILAGFAWVILPPLGISRRRCAILIALLTLCYALVTGGRPSAMRASVLVAAVSGGILLRREVKPTNGIAMCWIAVALLNPMDLFTAGCQLSFLCVAVLNGGVSHWLKLAPVDPLDELINESRPFWLRMVRRFGAYIRDVYIGTFYLMIATMPLVCEWAQLIAPIGILIGPPLILLTSIALIAGFCLLAVSTFAGFLVPIFTFILDSMLAMCESIVNFADRIPFGHFYIGELSMVWLIVFHIWLFALMIFSSRRRFIRLGALICLVALLGSFAAPSFRDELRITFLDVGHGSCIVIETPDGRTMLYDTGAIGGPDVTRYVLAPYLWDRGIHRIDEVFLSHADLDHINGIPQLLERFRIGQITLTETFAQHPTPGATKVLETLNAHRIPIRTARTGDIFQAGAIRFTVLHPPAKFERGSENARSLVLLLEHRGHRILLTGDLADEGLPLTFRHRLQPVDVLMSPHHGSKTSNTDELAKWASPKCVVSSQGRPRATPDPFAEIGAKVWTTHDHGAITIRSHATGLMIDTFGTRLHEVIRIGSR